MEDIDYADYVLEEALRQNFPELHANLRRRTEERRLDEGQEITSPLH